MKITDIRQASPVTVPVREMGDAINVIPGSMTYGYLEVHTDEGLTGICPGLGMSSFVDNLKPYVIGEDPLDSEKIWEKMYWGCLGGGRRGAAISAISAIDVAIWDLKGKILNQPVHKLLGGHHETVAAYGSGIDRNYTSEELVEEMTGFVNSGYKMVKMKIGGRDTNEDLERVRLVRETIGPDIDLALDVNNGWSLTTAIRMAHKLEKYDIYWLEEPILADEIENLAKLANETSIPIAVGENHYTRWEFKELIERGAVEIVQAQIDRCGGVTEFIKIAAMADAYGLPMCPHFSLYTDVSVVAAIPNGVITEYSPEFFKPVEKLFGAPVKPVNGESTPSSKPGFGIELDLEEYERMQAAPRPDTGNKRFGTSRGWRWPPYL